MTVKLRDQIPLSQNSDITVEAVELTGGNLNRVTGEITWDLEGRAARDQGDHTHLHCETPQKPKGNP